eukprot:GSA25T00018588001.1
MQLYFVAPNVLQQSASSSSGRKTASSGLFSSSGMKDEDADGKRLRGPSVEQMNSPPISNIMKVLEERGVDNQNSDEASKEQHEDQKNIVKDEPRPQTRYDDTLEIDDMPIFAVEPQEQSACSKTSTQRLLNDEVNPRNHGLVAEQEPLPTHAVVAQGQLDHEGDQDKLVVDYVLDAVEDDDEQLHQQP